MITHLHLRYFSLGSLLLLNSIVIIAALHSSLTPNRILETWLFSLILYRFSLKLIYIYLGLCALLIAVYHPSASLHGPLNFGIVASLLASNGNEAVEFLTMIPGYIYLTTLALASIPLISAYFLGKHFPKTHWRWHISLCFLIIINALAGITAYNKHPKYQFPLRVQPIEFITQFVLMANDYLKAIQEQKANLNKPDQWQINSVNQPYKNYVLVIGESARVDYHHLYGFKYANTPFMDRHVNVMMDNVISAGPNTIISLTHELTLSHQGKITGFQNSILTLAKKAGMHTIWLSNQGIIDQHNLPISIIAHYAQKVVFLKKGDFTKDNTNDTQLLPYLQQILAKPNTQNQLIVLHLMGSHNDPCARLQKPAHHYVKNMNSNCYIDTIRQTDNLLDHIYAQLNKTKQPFSLLYFSDHGLSHHYTDGNKTTSILEHTDQFYQNYHVPFVIINSDQQGLVHNSAHRSGLYFIDGLAAWLGIDSPQLPYSKMFFSQQDSSDIQVFGFDQQLKSVNNLQDDPLPPDLQ